jgi:predicted DNA-binding WGR domain protein
MSRRELQLIEGTSQKFWSIELDDTAHTVQFGRIGTAGQSQRKEFKTAAEAKASYDKLIAEKVKKGYAETSGTSTATALSAAPAAPRPARAKSAPRAEETAAPPPPSEPEPEIRAAAGLDLLSTVRSIDLDPDDWLWATWRPRTPTPRPEPAPFDLESCLERLASVTRTRQTSNWNWSKIQLAPTMDRAEAHFWLFAVSEVLRRDLQPGFFVQELRAQRKTFDRNLTVKEAANLARKIAQKGCEPMLVLLVHLFAPTELIALTQERQGLYHHQFLTIEHALLDGFRRQVLPYLSHVDYRTMQDNLRAVLDPPALPPNFYTAFPFGFYLAALLGLHEEVGRLVRSFPDDHYTGPHSGDFYQRPQLLVLGLGDPQSVESEMRRLKLVLKKPDYLRGWIAHTEDSALDVVRDSILTITSKDECAELIDVFARAVSPRAAAPMLELMLASKAPKGARDWLELRAGHAIAGLIPVAAGKGKLADAVLEYLRDQKRRGHEAFIRECLASASPEAAEKVRREVLDRAEVFISAFDPNTTPEWLKSALDGAAKLFGPSWVGPGDLPTILVGDRTLSEPQVDRLLGALVKSTLGAPHPLVAAIRAHADRRSLDAFAWALFERWLVEGAPSKEKWAMGALGLLGSEGAALKLTPMVRAWPGESQHPRAVFGLECLRAIGSDVALMQLSGIAQKLPFKGLKAKATEMMEAIAKDRGLSRAELDDRIVPDCELDERGGRLFDFGPRQFRFALGNEMKPMVRDEAGKLKDDLPKPGAKDDAAKATAAVEDWKRLKKQVREVAKVQAERLEQAMVTGRRWSPADFESLLVRHPLMINLVRLVLWGGYDEKGRLVSTFRVTEERDYADSKESSTRLDGIATVGIVHPLHLTDEQRSAWGEIFGDYEIIPPFPQLGRTVHRLEPGQENDKDLVKGRTITVPAVTLVGILERHGWNRGIPEDGGVFSEHTKPFLGANVTAVIQYPGIPVGYMVDWEDQKLESCFFVPGTYTPEMYPDHKKALPLGAVDPVVISEVLGTLGVLTSKGK